MFVYNIYHIVRQNEFRRYFENGFNYDGQNMNEVNERTFLIAEPKNGHVLIKKLFIIPQRYVLGIMGFLAVVNAYTMRVTLSVAITEMVEPTREQFHTGPGVCHGSFGNITNSVTDPTKLYPWTGSQQGLILSSFYWGYVITHIPGGLIAEKFGGKHSLGLGILCTALFTFITPFVIYATNGAWEYVVLLRVIEGLGEGTTFPSLNVLLAQWVPIHERSKIGTLVFAGSQIGTVAGNYLSGILIDSTKDWASVFYVFGALGIVWVFLWTILCYPTPQSHPFISEKEKLYLRDQIVHVSNSKKRSTPWKAILTSVPVWALVCAQIGHDWGFFTMVTDLPKYMKDVLQFNVKQNGIWSSVPYIFMWLVSMSSGWFCDFIIKRHYISVTNARKLFTTTASLGPAFFIIAASYSGCDRDLAVIMFTIAMGFMGTFYCGMKVNALDLSPNFAGTLMAIVNGIGAITGIVVPYLASALTEDHTILEWRTVFWIAFAVFVITNIIFIFCASGDVQSWNNVNDEENIDIKELQSNKENEARQH